MRSRKSGSKPTTTPPSIGNVAGAVIGSTIKSGTNDYHGNGFEYWRDSSMAANSWENNRAGAKKADLSQHIFGATLGGPIVKNKLFFFGDYQGFIRDRPGELVSNGGAGVVAAGRLLRVST